MENSDDKLSVLEKYETQGYSLRHNKSIEFIHNLIKKLNNKYDPFDVDSTYTFIKKFLERKNGLDRILYSELNKCIGFESERKDGIDALTSNIDRLFNYAIKILDVNTEIDKLDRDTIKVITKIFDHCNLYIVQRKNINDMGDNVASSVTTEVTKEVTDKIKSGVEREYITILSIFSAVILAFVGGLTYSTSVLSNINQIEIYRLILVCDVIGFFVFNIIYMLIALLCKLNRIDFTFFDRWLIIVNLICIFTAILIKVNYL